MSARFSTTKLNDDVHEVLTQLQARCVELGHTLAWFIDRDNRARLLVTVDAERETIHYQAGDVTHTVNVPVARRSADIELALTDVRLLGVDGLLCHIENQLGVPIAPAAPAVLAGQPVTRRVA